MQKLKRFYTAFCLTGAAALLIISAASKNVFSATTIALISASAAVTVYGVIGVYKSDHKNRSLYWFMILIFLVLLGLQFVTG